MNLLGVINAEAQTAESRSRALSGVNARRPSLVDRHVGAQLRAMRKARALTQAELGNALGVSAMQVQKYERGRDRIGAGSLFDAACMLGVKVSAFFEGLG